MAFGKIYKSSWWGTAHVNDIGFGSIYKDLPPGEDIVSPFRSRVLADGGTFEAADCVTAEINRIKAI